MDPAASEGCTVFAGPRRIASGSPGTVVAAARAEAAKGLTILAFDDATGHLIELDLRPDAPPPESRHRGRPKLGVTAREVTLLPRHWDWLAVQPGGASITLRRLVEAARKAPGERVRAGQETAYRFMTGMAGDQPGYEAATRALFAGDRDGFQAAVAAWPDDVGDYARRLAEDAFGLADGR